MIFECVLASKKSRLIGVIIDEKEYTMLSVDSESMMRVWDLGTGQCLRSYMIE